MCTGRKKKAFRETLVGALLVVGGVIHTSGLCAIGPEPPFVDRAANDRFQPHKRHSTRKEVGGAGHPSRAAKGAFSARAKNHVMYE